MMAGRLLLPIVGGFILQLSSAVAVAEPLSVLLEKGIYAEETLGDLDKAIQIYGRITAKSKAERPIAAQAQFRQARCLPPSGFFLLPLWPCYRAAALCGEKTVRLVGYVWTGGVAVRFLRVMDGGVYYDEQMGFGLADVGDVGHGQGRSAGAGPDRIRQPVRWAEQSHSGEREHGVPGHRAATGGARCF